MSLHMMYQFKRGDTIHASLTDVGEKHGNVIKNLKERNIR